MFFCAYVCLIVLLLHNNKKHLIVCLKWLLQTVTIAYGTLNVSESPYLRKCIFLENEKCLINVFMIYTNIATKKGRHLKMHCSSHNSIYIHIQCNLYIPDPVGLQTGILSTP